MADLVLPRGKVKVLQAEDKDYKRGLLVRLLKDGGYDMAYWYDKPDKPYPVEVLVDGKSIKKDAKVVEMKFHPKDYYDKQKNEMLNRPNYIRNQAPIPANQKDGEHTYYNPDVKEDWSKKYKKSIDCNNPKGFSQKAHCAGRKKSEMLNPPNYLRNVGNVPQNNPDGEHRFKKGKDQKETIMKLSKFVKQAVQEVIAEDKINLFVEKNVPTNPSKWSYYKSQAKKKFDVYPSAYANAWAAKQYKAAGGGWKKG